MKTLSNGVRSAAEKRRAMAELERMWPEMMVFAGPFDIQSKDLQLQKAEKNACAKLKAEFQAGGVPVRVVLNSYGAWVLRARAGVATWATQQLAKSQTVYKLLKPETAGVRTLNQETAG